ncbi:AQJ64_40280 family protein [Streptomyces asoensis]|uniref:AQJ64_40280 family protein n=1 Tax=Streptomyces asoensis TaxID=249586 RepID=UPI0034052246
MPRPRHCPGRRAGVWAEADVPSGWAEADVPSGWARVEETILNTVVTWVDVREGLPRSGTPVAAAITGRYPADSGTEPDTGLGEEFWLVRPMYFTALHWSEDGAEHRDCFVDSDGVVRLPHGLGGAETVTHWAELPTLPGGMTHVVLGEDAAAALHDVWGAGPLN